MTLTLPGGEMVNTLTWTITGPNDASANVVQQGTINVSSSLTVSFLVSNIPPGGGYAVSVSGTSTDGVVTCTGSAGFSIAPQQTTAVTVLLQCNAAPSEAGSIQVTGDPYDCASAGSITALPAETTLGGSVMLTGAAAGVNPGAIAYLWSAPSGTFSAADAGSTSFTCTMSGPIMVTLTVGDGPIPEGGSCTSLNNDTASIQIQCDVSEAGSSDAGSG